MTLSINRFLQQLLFAAIALAPAWASGADAPVNASVDDSLTAAATRVLAGRDRAYATFKACEPQYRTHGFDARFFVWSWDARRFEIVEGARMTLALAQSSGKDADKSQQTKGDIASAPAEVCEVLASSSQQGNFSIEGVAEKDLQSMRDVYAASHPNPSLARDRSLYSDCMKGNFNAKQMDFQLARSKCDCILAAMQSVPSDQLDSWLASERAGAGVPMQKQPWFEALLPKLMACTVR